MWQEGDEGEVFTGSSMWNRPQFTGIPPHHNYGLDCVSPNSFLESLTPNMTAFRDGTFRELIRVK